MEGSWIWIGDNQSTENERVCFVKPFDVQNLMNIVNCCQSLEDNNSAKRKKYK